MKRYFYTDPLAAAWMAKHFKMEFGAIRGVMGEITRSNGEPLGRKYIENLDWPGGRHFYIHPDSLHLLEPKEGDLLVEAGRIPIPRTVDGDVDYNGFGHNCAILFASEKLRGGRARIIHIIQRDGKPFHWPEQET